MPIQQADARFYGVDPVLEVVAVGTHWISCLVGESM